MENQGIHAYFSAIQDLQNRVINGQEEMLETIAEKMAEVIIRDGRIFIFGTGHSNILAEEAFYRAGGLAAVVPIFVPALMLHENANLSSKIERTGGLAASILDRYQPLPGEMFFIISNSGVNMLPVEMAIEAKARGAIVVAIVSLDYASVAPLSFLGKRLDEVADYVLDNGGQPGDSIVSIDGVPWRVGPSSTIIGALLWNALITEVVYRLRDKNAEIPVFASLNMQGALEHNRALMEKWAKINPHLR